MESSTQDPHPVDPFEVAAIIESGGVTDAVARERFRFPDAFTLARSLFEEMRAQEAPGVDVVPDPAAAATATARALPAAPPSTPGGPVMPGADPPARQQLSHLDSARHPMLAVVPSLALLTAIWLLSAIGRFSQDRVLALTIGMTTGMLCTNGVALGMGRRASRLISLGKLAASRRFLLGCLLLAVASTAVATSALMSVEVRWLSSLTNEAETFVLSATALAAVWVLAAALSLVSRSGWTGVALCAGVAVGLVVDRALELWTPAHLRIGTISGVAVTITLMLTAVDRGLRARSDRSRDTDHTLPSLGYLVLEGAPSFWYGTLGVVMFVTVHALGWVDVHGAMPAVSSLELGLFLTLGPVVLGGGQSERSLRLFWNSAVQLQDTTSLSRAGTFNARLTSQFHRGMAAYLRTIVLLSLLTAVAIEAMLRSGLLTRLVPYLDVGSFRTVYLSSLLAYGLLGWGQYNSMYGMAMARWRGPLLAVTVGTVLTLAVGTFAVARSGYDSAATGLAVGAAAYGAIALISTRRLLAVADHSYVHAL